MSSAKRLIAIEMNILPTLNPTLNITKIVNKSKCEVKAHLLKQPHQCSLLLQVFDLLTLASQDLYLSTLQVSLQASLLCQKSHTYHYVL